MMLLVVSVINTMSLAILKPPEEWGDNGADIVCGEGQASWSVPLASCGPYFGFITCKMLHIRQMPQVVFVGRTVDLDDKEGFI